MAGRGVSCGGGSGGNLTMSYEEELMVHCPLQREGHGFDLAGLGRRARGSLSVDCSSLTMTTWREDGDGEEDRAIPLMTHRSRITKEEGGMGSSSALAMRRRRIGGGSP